MKRSRSFGNGFTISFLGSGDLLDLQEHLVLTEVWDPRDLLDHPVK